MVFEDSPLLLVFFFRIKNELRLELRLFNFEEFVSLRKWSKCAYKNGVRGGQIK